MTRQNKVDVVEDNRKLNHLFEVFKLIVGFSLVAIPVYLVINSDFIAKLLTQTANQEQVVIGLLIIFGFFGGLILLIEYLLKTGLSEDYYEFPPL